MAHFIGYLDGSRGPASRLGTPKSGITAKAQGWDVGARIACYVGDDGLDHVCIELTGGSNQCGNYLFLGDFTAADLGKVIE